MEMWMEAITFFVLVEGCICPFLTERERGNRFTGTWGSLGVRGSSP